MPWILLHLNLADLLADLPSINWAKMPLIWVHQTWQIWPYSIKCRCLEYHYTQLGRSTWQIYPHQWSIDALNTTTLNLADLPPNQLSIDALNTSTPSLADLPPSMEHRCLGYHYTKLGRSIGRSISHQLSIDALNTATPNLADLPPINWA